MNLSPETLVLKSQQLEEAIVKRDNSARAVDALKEDLKTEKGYLSSLDTLIRKLALEVATKKGEGDQLPLRPKDEPASAADRTEPLPLESNATPPAEALPIDPEEEKAATLLRNQLRHFVCSFNGQKVAWAQVVDAFVGHRAEALRTQLALLVDREEILVLLDGWRGRVGAAPALEPPTVAPVEPEPVPAPVNGPSDANVQRALLRILEGDPAGWHGEGELFAAVMESFPAECRPGASQLSRMLTDLQRSGRVEIWNETEGEAPSWKVIPKASKKAPKKKGRR